MTASSQASADSHDLIRAQGARENNLKDVSVEIPKHHLSVIAHADWIIGSRAGRGPLRRADRVRRLADLVAARSTLTGEHLARFVAKVARSRA